MSPIYLPQLVARLISKTLVLCYKACQRLPLSSLVEYGTHSGLFLEFSISRTLQR